MNSNASTYLAGQQLGSSRMSQLALIETSATAKSSYDTTDHQVRSYAAELIKFGIETTIIVPGAFTPRGLTWRQRLRLSG